MSIETGFLFTGRSANEMKDRSMEASNQNQDRNGESILIME